MGSPLRRKITRDANAQRLMDFEKQRNKKLKENFVVPVAIPVLPFALTLGYEAAPMAEFSSFIQPYVQAFGEEMVQKKLDKVAMQLKGALDAALEAPVWAWNSGTRDIVDTGALKGTGVVVVRPLELQVYYTAPYAMLVHNGGYIQPYGNPRARPIYLPPRPWIKSVLYGGGPVPRFDIMEALGNTN